MTIKQFNQLHRNILILSSWIILIFSNVFLFLFFKDIINAGNSYHLHIAIYCVMLTTCNMLRSKLYNPY